MSTDRQMLLRLARFARPQAPLFIAGLLTAPLSALVVISQPILLQQTIDDGIMQGDIETIKTISFYYLGAILIGFLLESSYTLFTTYGATHTIARLRRKVYDHTLSLSQSHHDRQLTGKLLTRTTSDIEALGETLSAGSISIVLDILLVIGILGAMFHLDWVLTLLLLATTPPLAIAINVTRKRLRTLYLQVRTSLSGLNAFTAERLTGLSVIQLYSDEKRVLTAYQEKLSRYRNAAIKTNIYDALLYAILDGLRAMTMALLLWYGAGQFFGGALTAGLLAAFIHYVSKLYRPIQEFSAKLATIQRASSALEKIFGLLDQNDFIDEGALDEINVSGSVEFKDVSFAYHGGQEVLSGINFTIHPGGVVALVGRTGSGKSTIGKLLTRAYGNYKGKITIDGHELCDMTNALARSTVATVRQDVQLFPGDVRMNLTMGADISDRQLTESISCVAADETVALLGGLDGIVAHRGANISVGQAQLLSFARTMAHSPPIVVLDEATASVDSVTEAKIQAATEHLLKHNTVLVIAHRLSTILYADEILVLETGRIIERGNHADLMRQKGHYAFLFEQADIS